MKRELQTPEVVSPLAYRERVKRWRFVLTRPLQIQFPGIDWGRAVLVDAGGTPRVELDGELWTVLTGYAWDGCSPKLWLGFWFGTPDFRATIPASCWHDSAGQFFHTPCVGNKINRAEWNNLFRQIIVGENAPIVGNVYGAALQAFNPAYQAIGKLLGNKPTGTCKLWENRK